MSRSIRPGSTIISGCVALIAIAATLGGCGYHFAASGSGLPAQAKTIYIENFSNHTRYTGINDEFMRYLKDEVANHKRLVLVDTPDEADLVLSGEVRYVETRPLASNPVGEPILYGETLNANATLTDSHTHRVIWTSQGIGGSGQAPAVASAVLTTSPIFLQQNLRSQDIGNLPDLQLAQTQRAANRQYDMQQMAQNLYTSMAEGF
jgi:hypothetical protein